MSWYRQQLEDFLADLDVEADTVLDIGGEQLPVEGRTKSWKVGEYSILDLPKFDIEKYRNINIADIIFCLEVFEYLIRPLDALKNIRLILKPGGTAYITVPLSYPVHEEVEFDSLRYTEGGFGRLCAAANLKVNQVNYRYDRSGLLQAFYAADGMHPAKGIDHQVTGYIFEVTK